MKIVVYFNYIYNFPFKSDTNKSTCIQLVLGNLVIHQLDTTNEHQ